MYCNVFEVSCEGCVIVTFSKSEEASKDRDAASQVMQLSKAQGALDGMSLDKKHVPRA